VIGLSVPEIMPDFPSCAGLLAAENPTGELPRPLTGAAMIKGILAVGNLATS
jgi:hypothetical protein